MRIVAGKHRGRRLTAPRGWHVRPTSDRVRESTFDLLLHGVATELTGACVVDVFAGTGAFGFEALSRGAAHAVFVDANPRAIKAIRDNAARLDEQDHATALRRDAHQPGPPPPETATGCQLAFFDPPYDKGLLKPALSAFARMGWFARDAVAVVETSDRENVDPPAQFALIKERRYASTRVLIYRWQAS